MDEYYEETDYEEEDAEDEFSCDHCGPWCSDWGGDGLCMLAIEQQANEQEEYDKNFIKENQTCPVCKQSLKQYEVPVDELWTWPGDFYNPMVAIGIFGILDTPKGEIHRSGNLCHVWVGAGEYREEKLILLSGKRSIEEFPF